MTHAPTTIEWKIPNRMADATRLAREAFAWVDSFAVSDQAKYNVRLILEEMLSNVIKYGYDDDREHLISICLRLDGDAISIELVDDANPFDPNLHLTPEDIAEHLDQGEEGGFGIALVRSICGNFDYRRENNRNRVTLHVGALDPDAPLPSRSDDSLQGTLP
jgi:serine/threonine-protein kinase RsbW